MSARIGGKGVVIATIVRLAESVRDGAGGIADHEETRDGGTEERLMLPTHGPICAVSDSMAASASLEIRLL
jgi:hypothetical protein